jgi:Tfp pilus assembly protein PilV
VIPAALITCRKPLAPYHSFPEGFRRFMLRARITSQAGFTLIEVGMAALILVVAFIGMIRALTFTSGLMDHARRQTVATQILTHEIEQLRLRSWTEINALPTTTTWVAATAYAADAIVSYQGGVFRALEANTGRLPSQSNAWAASMAYDAATAYVAGDLVSNGGVWYRCIAASTGNAPPNVSFWVTYSGPIANSGISDGATYTVSRTATTLATHAMREITVTVSWTVVSGRVKADNTPLIFTYSRVNTAYFGKNGLSLTYQRS